MKDSRIVLIGDTPAIYVCSIYLHTANAEHTVIRKDLGLQYTCNVLPGLEASKEEYNQKCYEQVVNMGIEVVSAESVSVSTNGNYLVKYDGKTIEADIVVTDRSLGSPASENMYIVEDRITRKEGIILGGEGCKIAFAIKDKLN